MSLGAKPSKIITDWKWQIYLVMLWSTDHPRKVQWTSGLLSVIPTCTTKLTNLEMAQDDDPLIGLMQHPDQQEAHLMLADQPIFVTFVFLFVRVISHDCIIKLFMTLEHSWFQLWGREQIWSCNWVSCLQRLLHLVVQPFPGVGFYSTKLGTCAKQLSQTWNTRPSPRGINTLW